MKKVYIAKCIDGDGEPIEITHANYDALMEHIDAYGYDVLDVIEMDYDKWSAKVTMPFMSALANKDGGCNENI